MTTGIINDDYVEILYGLSEGDEVYVSSDSGSTTSRISGRWADLVEWALLAVTWAALRPERTEIMAEITANAEISF